MARDIKVLGVDELTPCVGVVLGTRPGIIMLAPVLKALERRGLPHFAVHTGQHYSPSMDAWLFEDLRLEAPAHRIEGTAGYTTHGGQTAHMLQGIERILLERRPRLVLVGGDANTNLAGALAARKLGIMVGHVEAGERSFDWSMPEEHNRRLIDHMSDILFATGTKAEENLAREAVCGHVVRSGNTIVDASLMFSELARERTPPSTQAEAQQGERFALLTLHREENVDRPERLRPALQGVSAAAQAIGFAVRFLVHPRTRKRLEEFELLDWAETLPGLRLCEPLGYLDFLQSLTRAELVFTDSGGVQQEACIHHVGCVTLRDNTEWMETVEIGANRIAGCSPAEIVRAAEVAMRAPREWSVPFGDGRAAETIVDSVEQLLDSGTCSSGADAG